MQDQIITKTCYHCLAAKPGGEFNKDTRKKDGLDWLCRVCRQEHSQSYYKSRREEYIQKRREARKLRTRKPSTAMDLTGEQYGYLTVVSRVGYYEFNWRGRISKDTTWLCRCECGEERTIRANTLRSGRQSSCGCKRKGPNLLGRKFGKLTVVEYIKAQGWRCVCDCGRERITRSAHLLESATVQCETCRIVDLTGRVFGRLRVIERAERPENVKHTAVYWRCMCECGNEHITRTDYLRTGRSKSCGCWLREHRLIGGEQGLWNQRLNHHKWQAERRKIDHSLSMDEFKKLSISDCHYCGIGPCQKRTWTNASKQKRSLIFNGIDRLNSDVGYVAGNVVAACKYCNVGKHEQSYQEFKAWVARVYDHLIRPERKAKAASTQMSLAVGA